jgi:hypothetical protein
MTAPTRSVTLNAVAALAETDGRRDWEAGDVAALLNATQLQGQPATLPDVMKTLDAAENDGLLAHSPEFGYRLTAAGAFWARVSK